MDDDAYRDSLVRLARIEVEVGVRVPGERKGRDIDEELLLAEAQERLGRLQILAQAERWWLE